MTADYIPDEGVLCYMQVGTCIDEHPAVGHILTATHRVTTLGLQTSY